MSTPNSGLGRGLDALLPDADEGVTEVAVGKVTADPDQPRQTFHDTELDELAQSIRQHGLLQPLIVSPAGGDSQGDYQLIAGERRLRAAKLAGLSNVPVVIRTVEQQQRFELALIENLQRSDLSPLEEARAYARLMDEGGETQEQLAKRLGKGRSRIAQLVRILKLPASMQRALERGEITTGHAQALLSLEGADQERLFAVIVERKLSVREAERQAAGTPSAAARRGTASAKPDWLRQLERELGQPVERRGSNQRGSLVIKYDSGEQLEAIVRRLSGRE